MIERIYSLEIVSTFLAQMSELLVSCCSNRAEDYVDGDFSSSLLSHVDLLLSQAV